MSTDEITREAGVLTSARHPRTRTVWKFPQHARRYSDRVSRMDYAHDCEHGHFECALWERGPCVNEAMSALPHEED